MLVLAFSTSRARVALYSAASAGRMPGTQLILDCTGTPGHGLSLDASGLVPPSFPHRPTRSGERSAYFLDGTILTVYNVAVSEVKDDLGDP